VTEGGWTDLPDELVAKVLELLQAAGQQEGGFGFSQASATVRLVCAGWKAVHDAVVKRLVLRRETTDEVVGMLVLRFPAVASLEMKSVPGDTLTLTDQGVQADDGRGGTSCTSRERPPFAQVSQPPRLRRGHGLGVRALSSLPALASLDLRFCHTVTAAGVQALRTTTAASTVHIESRRG
jgi:hypothetical protein